MAIAMEKGGVGKTTTCTNLAAAFAGHFGMKVLVIDFDSQADTTTILHGRPENGVAVGPTLYQVLMIPTEPAEAIRPATVCGERLHVLLGDRNLKDLERRIVPAKWDVVLDEIRTYFKPSLPTDYDLILIDTPPGLDFWMHAALVIADGVLVVAKPEQLAADKLPKFQQTVAAIRATQNPDLQVLGILPNDVIVSTVEHKGWLDQLSEAAPGGVLPFVPHAIVIPGVQREGYPIEFAPNTDRKIPEVRELYRTIAGILAEKAGLPVEEVAHV